MMAAELGILAFICLNLEFLCRSPFCRFGSNLGTINYKLQVKMESRPTSLEVIERAKDFFDQCSMFSDQCIFELLTKRCSASSSARQCL